MVAVLRDLCAEIRKTLWIWFIWKAELNIMSTGQPELVSPYSEFLDFRNQAQIYSTIDLKNRDWLRSSGVLLLADLKSEFGIEVISTGRSKMKWNVSYVSGQIMKLSMFHFVPYLSKWEKNAHIYERRNWRLRLRGNCHLLVCEIVKI